MPRGFQNCPVLGVGLGLRRPLLKETLSAAGLIDWLEFTPENYIDRGGSILQGLKDAHAGYPLVSHGVSLSIGSTDPWNEEYLSKLEDLFAWIDPPWFSDHLCFSSIGGVYSNDLLPLPRTQATVDHVADRVKYLQDRFQRPVLIEHVSQYLNWPNDAMADAEFITAILEAADCGLLLDVNNVYVNTRNHGGDPKAFIQNIPLSRVVQVHVAGHKYSEKDGLLIDTHGAPVIDPVWDLLHFAMSQPGCRPCGVMIERDNNIPPFAELVCELEQLRAVWQATGQPEILRREVVPVG